MVSLNNLNHLTEDGLGPSVDVALVVPDLDPALLVLGLHEVRVVATVHLAIYDVALLAVFKFTWRETVLLSALDERDHAVPVFNGDECLTRL